MQEIAPAIPSWIFQVLRDLAIFIGGGGIVKLAILWQNRRKPQVEISAITIKSQATAGDSLGRMIDRLDRSVAQNERLRSERDDLQEKCDTLEIEIASYDRQMKRMKGFMDSKGIKYSEMDELK